MRLALASMSDRLLTLLVPKADASAGACEYRDYCTHGLCRIHINGPVYPYTRKRLYSNCEIVNAGCCTKL